MAAALDGTSSRSVLTVDTSLVPFGEEISLDVRTRSSAGRLVFVQYISEALLPLASVEVQLFNSEVQLTLKSDSTNQGEFTLVCILN